VICVAHVRRPRRDERPSASDKLPTSSVFFCCDDLAETYDELRSRGVEFLLASQPALLFGRRTYEDFYGFWPQQTDNPFTEVLNDRSVASRTLEEPLNFW
jgi:hypothetical protein